MSEKYSYRIYDKELKFIKWVFEWLGRFNVRTNQRSNMCHICGYFVTCCVCLTAWVHSKKRTTCSGLMKTALNNVVLPTLFNVVNNIVQHCWAWISPQSGVTMLNNIVDNIEQCGQHNIVQGCFHQPWTGCAFLRVYHPFAFKRSPCIKRSFPNTSSVSI